jgi:hypothetical protein
MGPHVLKLEAKAASIKTDGIPRPGITRSVVAEVKCHPRRFCALINETLFEVCIVVETRTLYRNLGGCGFK